MKKNALLLFLCMLAQCAFAQVVAIQNNNANVVFICLDNPITMAAADGSLSSLIVTTDNGAIIPNPIRGSGHYLFKPEKIGVANVTVKKKQKNGKAQIIDHMIFRVKKIPYTTALCGGKKGGSMSKQILCEQTELLTRTFDYSIDMPFKIAGYTVAVYRDTISIYRKSISENKIDNETIQFFYSLNNLDKVIFKDIFVKDCVDQTILPSMDFIITDADEFRKRK